MRNLTSILYDLGDWIDERKVKFDRKVDQLVARELQAYSLIQMAMIEKLPQPKRGVELKKWYINQEKFQELFSEHWVINPQGSITWLLLGWVV